MGGGGLCWRGEVTECAHWRETMSALILLWHNQTIRGGLLTKLYYSALVSGPIWRVISWDGSIHEASPNTTGRFFTTVLLVGDCRQWKRPRSDGSSWNLLWRLLITATHTVIAVLTQVIASNEKGHQLPVILKMHRLRGRRKNQNKRDGTFEDIILVSAWMSVLYVLNSQSHFSWCQSGAGPAPGFLCMKWEILHKMLKT